MNSVEIETLDFSQVTEDSLIIFNVYTGKMPHHRTKQYIEDVAKRFDSIVKRIESKGGHCHFIAARDSSSSIEKSVEIEYDSNVIAEPKTKLSTADDIAFTEALKVIK